MRKQLTLFIFLISVLSLIIALSNVTAYEIFYYHSDSLGSPVAITDGNGSVVWRTDYKPFGQSLNEVSEDGVNNYQYNAKEKDDSGLFYYGARYYDADLGRFVTADTIGGNIKTPQTLNRYVYTLNNPLKFIDPTGNQASGVIQLDVLENYKIGGVLPQKISGYFTSPKFEQFDAFSSLKTAAERTGVDIYSLTGAIFQEGYGVLLECQANWGSFQPTSWSPVGLEAFGNEVGALKKQGYLRTDFSEYVNFGSPEYNELGDVKFQIVKFSSNEALAEAFASVYSSRRDLFLEDAAKLGYDASTFSQEIIDAWSYSYYVNPGMSRENLQEHGPDLIYQPSGKWESAKERGSKFSVSDLGRRAAATSNYLRGNDFFGVQQENWLDW